MPGVDMRSPRLEQVRKPEGEISQRDGNVGTNGGLRSLLREGEEKLKVLLADIKGENNQETNRYREKA
jgi:hypothetical protein